MNNQEKQQTFRLDLFESVWLERQRAKRAFEFHDRIYNCRARKYDEYVNAHGNPLAEGESALGNQVLGALYSAEGARNAAKERLDRAEMEYYRIKQEEA